MSISKFVMPGFVVQDMEERANRSVSIYKKNGAEIAVVYVSGKEGWKKAFVYRHKSSSNRQTIMCRATVVVQQGWILVATSPADKLDELPSASRYIEGETFVLNPNEPTCFYFPEKSRIVIVSTGDWSGIKPVSVKKLDAAIKRSAGVLRYESRSPRETHNDPVDVRPRQDLADVPDEEETKNRDVRRIGPRIAN